MNDAALLFGAGLAGAALNALGGGGSFLTLPALMSVGLSATAANASSTVALFPGGAASVYVYRRRLGTVCGIPLRPTLAATVAGGLAGALLLLWTPTRVFDRLLPWLLLAACTALAAGPRLGPALRRRLRVGRRTILPLQFLLGLYGGYFGGAVGLMMTALWSLLDEVDLGALQGPRVLMATSANGVAVLCFLLAGAARWPATGWLAAGAALGGALGALLGRRLSPRWTRRVTVGLAASITALFFLRTYAR